MIRTALLMASMAGGLLVACTSAPEERPSNAAVPAPAAHVDPAMPPPADQRDPAARAQAAAADFSRQLRSALQGQLQAGGPEAAVEFCHAQAPLIAEQVATTHGVRLGRVAVPGRNRHPAHEPQGWQRDTLAAFQAAVDAGEAAAAQLSVQRDDLPAGVALRMMRGIAVESPCLACHGKSVAPEVAAAIARHYPQDRATGFDVGDLRGALWVEVPASPSN